jgi:putative tryptophan/tyrosine transport system substrate-binding protein
MATPAQGRIERQIATTLDAGMGRRQFIAVLGGAAIALPGAVFAQTASRIYRVGLLNAGEPISDTSYFGAAIVRGFEKHGYALGRNLTLERRGAQAHIDRLPKLVDELLASKVDVILTVGYPAGVAAKRGTTTVPIVVTGFDPVATGLVDGLARPGGNITGISDVAIELTAKRLELLKETTAGLHRVPMLWNAADLGMTLRYKSSATVAEALGVTVQPLGVREPEDFEEAFAAMIREPPDAILMVSDVLTILNRRRVYEFAAAHRLPAIYEHDLFCRDGGLMSYGPDTDEIYDRATGLVDRILKGAKPAELPLEQPTRFRFVINLKTAKALGLTIPPTLLARADEVIE